MSQQRSRRQLSGVTVPDIAKALASMAGVKALSDYDAGLTGGYLNKAEDCCSGRFGTILFGKSKEESMAWMTPVLVEICIGLEFNGYLPADGYVPPEF